ncbi:hypothetical protein BDP27DRAFT_1433309 [Rhodocollybia butyracea]|uniref:Uncharacterized protein n=1 Tax=Rhodocollybia butyracea TaxID=206335 RepID=A0A9P5P3P8_9AGAR|nr:hypothetical protein BDP27DRAFT_1433309 [Rhodocollybia butyracea]
MADIPIRIRKRFHPYDSSFEWADRPHFTHKDDATSARIKKLSTSQRSKLNLKINQQNKGHRERAFDGKENISDVESLADINEKEYDAIRSDPTTFEAHKKYFLLSTIHEMVLANRKEAEKAALALTGGNRLAPQADVASAGTIELEDDITLVPNSPTSHTAVSFPDEMRTTACQKHIFPLHLFHTKNDADAGPHREDDLDYNGWCKSMANLYAFKCSRYKSGAEAAHPMFLTSHGLFFDELEDANITFPFWFIHEWKLHCPHYDSDLEFNAIVYINTCTVIEAAINTHNQLLAAQKSNGNSNRQQD